MDSRISPTESETREEHATGHGAAREGQEQSRPEHDSAADSHLSHTLCLSHLLHGAWTMAAFLQNKEVISATPRYDTFQVNFQCISLHVRVLWDSTPAIPVISLKTPCACHTSAMLIHVIAYPSTRMVPFTDTLLLLRMLFLHGCPHVMQTYLLDFSLMLALLLYTKIAEFCANLIEVHAA